MYSELRFSNTLLLKVDDNIYDSDRLSKRLVLEDDAQHAKKNASSIVDRTVAVKKESTPVVAGDVSTNTILSDLKERFIALASTFFTFNQHAI